MPSSSVTEPSSPTMASPSTDDPSPNATSREPPSGCHCGRRAGVTGASRSPVSSCVTPRPGSAIQSSPSEVHATHEPVGPQRNGPVGAPGWVVWPTAGGVISMTTMASARTPSPARLLLVPRASSRVGPGRARVEVPATDGSVDRGKRCEIAQGDALPSAFWTLFDRWGRSNSAQNGKRARAPSGWQAPHGRSAQTVAWGAGTPPQLRGPRGSVGRPSPAVRSARGRRRGARRAGSGRGGRTSGPRCGRRR